jgi:hypothetical protein
MRLNDIFECARLSGNNTDAAAHVAGDWTFSGTFGSTASAAPAAGANDLRGAVVITSAGTGQGANPTATLTFKKPFAVAPQVFCLRGGGSQPLILFTPTSTTTTTAVFTFNGTPVAAETYTMRFFILE